MFKRLVASLKFPFLLLSFDILRPPNDAWLATSAKTGRESGEELVKITSVTCASWSPCSELENWPLLSYYRVCDHALTPDTKKMGVSETGKRGNKLHWDRSLGSWLRQSPPSIHLPKAGGQEMWDFEPIIPPLLAPRRWDVSGTFLSDGERFRPVLRLRLKKNGYNSESP